MDILIYLFSRSSYHWALALRIFAMTWKVCVFLRISLGPKRVFAVSGFGGKYSLRRSSRAEHSKRWCLTVSSKQPQRGHSGLVLTPILFKWLFSWMCSDLSLKIVVCSCLLSLLISSLGFGEGICWNIGLPLVVFAHWSNQIFFLCCVICLPCCCYWGT